MFEEMKQDILATLKEASAYEVAQLTGLSAQAVSNIRNKKAQFENLRVGNLEKLALFANQHYCDLNGVAMIKDTEWVTRRVDFAGAVLVSFNNADHTYILNAPEVDGDNKPTGFYSDIKLVGTIDDVEKRIMAKHSRIIGHYAKVVNYDSTNQDPEGRLLAKCVAHVKANQSDFFDQAGDFLPHDQIKWGELEDIKPYA